MHVVNFLLAIGGDPFNQHWITGATVAELQVLRVMHSGDGGNEPVARIQVIANDRVDQQQEYDRLQLKYQNKGLEIIQALWRDGGGKFPTDIRQLGLPSAAFATEQHVIDDAVAEADAAAEETEAAEI